MPQQRSSADCLIAGAGLSGLLLARALLGAPTGGEGPKVVVADPNLRLAAPATYAFWAQGPTVLDPWVIGRWGRVAVVDHRGGRHVAPLRDWHYLAIDWRAARADLLAAVSADPRVTLLPDAVTAVRSNASGAAALIAGRWVTADWIFDSRPPPLAAPATSRRRPPAHLTQSFSGLWISTGQECLDPGAATLMDFSADASRELGFSYVLPVATDRALVMAVRMSAEASSPDPVPAVQRLVGRVRWEAGARESGATPLAVRASRRRHTGRVVHLGVRGGRARPSTGYAVARIIADCEAIVSSLSRHGHPLDLPPDPRLQRGLDRIWLRALARERAGLEPAFVSLFTEASPDAVLRFLDGTPSIPEVLSVVRALPPRPFLRALLR